MTDDNMLDILELRERRETLEDLRDERDRELEKADLVIEEHEFLMDPASVQGWEW